ncbi:MAG: hypothetical protein ISS26_02880 [Candidatus Omnitrophica bacterium]|nr:hypothetical protein [Candidatus Omnitrophota bacterium]
MKKKVGWISAIGGIISAVLGVIASCMLIPLCGGVCIAGPLVAIFGIGIAGFLHKYNIWFTIFGSLFFILGLFLIIKNRKYCTLGNIENHLRRLKKWYKEEKCRTCDCFQAALTQFELDGGDKVKNKLNNMKVFKDRMHSCLGCDPCPPGEIFSSYLKTKKKLTNS